MATRFIDKAAGTGAIRNLPDAAGIQYDTDDGFIKYNDAGTIRTAVNTDEAQTLTNKTLTSPTINGVVGTGTTESVITTNVITAAESGTTYFLNLAGGFASTLPAPAAGLFYRFIVGTAPSGGSYTVATNAAAQILAGQVYGSDGGDGDSETAATATTITFVDGASVIGDSAEVWSDGTSWFARCFCDVATTGITITG